jgi:hypothetical protein
VIIDFAQQPAAAVYLFAPFGRKEKMYSHAEAKDAS